MPKRKRSDDEEEAESSETLSVKQRRIQHKLEKSTAKIAHAFKVAKGLERQKLGRRRKKAVAETSEKDVQRIDAEIGALKSLDNATAAQHHFYKTLSKIKAVAEHADLPPEVVAGRQKPTADGAGLNVLSRLCTANLVREALDAAVGEIEGVLGVEGRGKEKGKRRDERAGGPRALVMSGREVREGMDGEVGADMEGEEEEEEEEEGMNDFDDRIANSSDEEGEGNDDDDDIDVNELERRLAEEGVQKKSKNTNPQTYNHEADLSLSDPDSKSPSPEPQKGPPTTTTKSSFLPSLTMGGYISGSDSEAEDLDAAPPKKNRRGQRARQQIWEQKFGAKAKHLQKQKRGTRDEGWDLRRGATDGSSGRRSGGRPGGEMGPAKKKKEKDDAGPLHPSWEAAKRAKERKEAGVVFEGRKTTFD